MTLRGRTVPAEIAEDVEILDICTSLGYLPNSGGLLDQDPIWVHKLRLFVREKAKLAQERAESTRREAKRGAKR